MTTKANIQSHIINLNDYKEIKLIQKGGFGAVYLVEHNSNHTKAAAKVNMNGPGQSEEQDKFISREIGILIRVQAPTIIQFYGFSLTDFQNNPNITILMEYKENGSLRQLIDKEQLCQAPHEYDNTAKQIILCGIAHGMMILHSRRVLHRDLKPDNVLLDAEFRPCITDFGLSKFLDPDNSKSQSMAGCGTAAFMAPEIITSNNYSLKSDVYSFGILMYEVVTGQHGYSDITNGKACNPFQITSKVADGARPTFNGINVKESFKQLIERCWSKDPRDRPSFKELFNKLSLSLEDDDESIRNEFKGLQENENDIDFDYYRYCLDDVAVDQLFDYVDEITAAKSPEHEDQLKKTIEEQAQRITELERRNMKVAKAIKNQNQKEIQELKQQHQQQIDEMKKQILSNHKEIKDLKMQNELHQKRFDEMQKQNQEEIESLKAQLKEIQNTVQQPAPTPKPVLSPILKPAVPGKGEANPLAGMNFEQMRRKIQAEKLQTITVPSSVTTIEDRAFCNCKSLVEIIIPSSVTTIEDAAFLKCGLLQKITIPTSVMSIGNGIFTLCSSLEAFEIPSSVTSIGSDTFSNCISLKTVKIPTSVTSIGDYAFSECCSLTELSIPSSVTSIGNYAFSNCIELKLVRMSSSVKSIGDSAFSRCPKLNPRLKAALEKKFGKRVL